LPIIAHFNNKLPGIFDNYFIILSKCHTVNTRRQAIRCNYCISRYKTFKQHRSIKYQGVSNWNSIYSFRKFKKVKTI